LINTDLRSGQTIINAVLFWWNLVAVVIYDYKEYKTIETSLLCAAVNKDEIK
jgi:hypothetical protein